MDLTSELDDFVFENGGEVSNGDIAQHFFELGKREQKQQMMKDAVSAWVNTYESVTNPYDNEVSFITNLSPSGFRNKEMVKIIIVKED